MPRSAAWFSKQCAMEASQSCRLCGGVADYSHRVALFSMPNTKKDLPGRVSRMLGVSVRQNDGRPTVLCRRCMNKFSALERDLEALKQKARATYDSFPDKENVTGSRKRTKNTSGSVVSPSTASVRPPAKRMDRCRLFANRESTWTRPIIIIIKYYSYYSIGDINNSSEVVSVNVTPELVNPTTCESSWMDL